MFALTQKLFPDNYSDAVVDVLSKMSLNQSLKHVRLAGSSTIRTLRFFADYDAYEVVQKPTAKQLQKVVRTLLKTPLCYITEFKGGEIKAWNVIQDAQTYNYTHAQEKLQELHSQHIITDEEYNEATSLLLPAPTFAEHVKIKKLLRFGVLRWTPKDILRGYLVLRDSTHYPLQKVFEDGSTTKLDVVAWIKDKFIEFTMLYFTSYTPLDLDDYRKDIRFYMNVGNYHKALKRMYTLTRAQLRRREKPDYDMEKIVAILNHPVSILYVILNDIQAIYYVMEHAHTLPKAHLRLTLQTIRENLGTLTEPAKLIHAEPHILTMLKVLEQDISKEGIVCLHALENTLNVLLNTETKRLMYEKNTLTR